ncbi:MAG: uroporphyrinogen decarboxylase family protein [Candidatus Hodarchaeota archaeon]
MAQHGEMEKGLGGLLERGPKPWIQIGAQMHDHPMLLAGIPAKKFYYDAKTLVETIADVAGYYQLDLFNAWGDNYNVEIEALGGKMIYGEKSMPTIDFRDPLIKEPEDLRKLKLKAKEVDWYKDGRIPFALDIINYCQEYGTNMGIFTAPFSLAVGLRSYPKLVKDMRKRPEFAHELFNFIVDDILIPYIRAQQDYCDIIYTLGPDAWAVVPNLSVKEMKEWVLPYNLEVTEKAKKFGVMAMCSSGDYCEERLEKFDVEVLHGCFDVMIESQGATVVSLGMGRWHEYPLEPVRDYTDKYREKGEKVIVSGGINARLLRDGPVEKIVGTIKRYIDTFARDYNLTIFLNNVPADTPPEHIHAAIAATHTYGRLPIADNLDEIAFELPHKKPFNEWKQNPTPFSKVEVRKGLAGLLWQQMAPINNIKEFKENYKDKTLKILYNLTDQKYGALITAENGKLDVKHILTDKETLKSLEVDSSMACTGELFFNFGKMSKISALLKMLTGKLKIKNAKKMKELGEIMAYLS